MISLSLSFSLSHTHTHALYAVPQLQLTAVKTSFNPVMVQFFDSRSVCSLCMNPSDLYEFSFELDLADMASEKSYCPFPCMLHWTWERKKVFMEILLKNAGRV